MPLAPSTTTRSPGCSRARQVRAIQAAMPDVPMAAAAASDSSPSIGTRSAVATAHSSARLPSPGRIPAVVANQTRLPVASSGDCRTTPIPCTPGTYGSGCCPK